VLPTDRPAPAGAPAGTTGATMHPVPRVGRAGVVAVVVAALLFAVNGTVSKIAMQSGLTPSRLVELRSLGSAVVLVAVLLLVADRARLPRGRELAALALLGIVGMAMVQWLYFVAISRLPVGLALLVEFTAPVLVALWARFVLHDDVRARVWWALAACLGGLTLVAQVGDGITLDAVGLVAAVGAAVSLATYYVLGDRLVRARDALSTQAWSMVFAALFWLALQPLWTFDATVLGDVVDLPGVLDGGRLPLWALVAWIVVLGTVLPYLLVLVGVRRLGAARTGVIGMLEPVAAAAAAWVVLGESMTAVQLLGGAVVLVGVGLAESARRSHAVDAAPDVVVSH
jgi:drug/metabolite transporter (DMT)-like permease